MSLLLLLAILSAPNAGATIERGGHIALPSDPERLSVSWFSELIEKARTMDAPVVGGIFEVRLMGKIREAHELLEKERPARARGGSDIPIVVLDSGGGLHVVRAVKTSSSIQARKGGDFDCELNLRESNGANSDIQCVRPDGCSVLALKYPYSGHDLIYTPYSPEIATADVQAEGMRVLKKFVSEAFSRLRERKVVSLSYPDLHSSCAPNCLAADVVPRPISPALMINEHVNPSDFSSPQNLRELVREPLVLLAANREKAWSKSVSKAGARGIMQFMPSTYRLLVRTYPLAGLNPDFESGTTDPVNALMAQILLCDINWHTIRDSGFEVPASEVGPYLAAAYNGGVSRVLTILGNSEHREWMRNPDPDKVPSKTVVRTVRTKAKKGRKSRKVQVAVKTKILPDETSKYVVQYCWITNYWDEFVTAFQDSGPLNVASEP
jgi:hypothetical protein